MSRLARNGVSRMFSCRISRSVCRVPERANVGGGGWVESPARLRVVGIRARPETTHWCESVHDFIAALLPGAEPATARNSILLADDQRGAEPADVTCARPPRLQDVGNRAGPEHESEIGRASCRERGKVS